MSVRPIFGVNYTHARTQQAFIIDLSKMRCHQDLKGVFEKYLQSVEAICKRWNQEDALAVYQFCKDLSEWFNRTGQDQDIEKDIDLWKKRVDEILLDDSSFANEELMPLEVIKK